MLKPSAGRAIRNALVRCGNVPLPEKRDDLIAECIGAAWLEDHASIGSLFGRRLDDPLAPVFDITLAFSSGVCTTGAIGGLKIALMHFISARWSYGIEQESWEASVMILTRTFRRLQVVQPFELPGIPTILIQRCCCVGRKAALGLALSIVDTENKCT